MFPPYVYAAAIHLAGFAATLIWILVRHRQLPDVMPTALQAGEMPDTRAVRAAMIVALALLWPLLPLMLHAAKQMEDQ